jgi:DNA end-binding protein Ku
MLDLALHIVQSKRADFEPEHFQDEYENAVKELLRKKQQGVKIERPREPSQTNVVDLMGALRASLAQTSKPSKPKKRVEGQREMLLPIAGKGRKDKSTARRAKVRRAG